jgi:hypothetical protein
VAEVEEIVPVGSLDPDNIHTPGIYVDRIVQTVSEKRIEQRTVRPRELLGISGCRARVCDARTRGEFARRKVERAVGSVDQCWADHASSDDFRHEPAAGVSGCIRFALSSLFPIQIGNGLHRSMEQCRFCGHGSRADQDADRRRSEGDPP